MKLLSIVSFLALSMSYLPAHAQFDDQNVANAAVECQSIGTGTHVFLTISAVSGGSSWQTADVYAGNEFESYTVVHNAFGFEVRYTGADFDLKIDTFSTGSPRFFETYDATLQAGAVNSRVRCEFRPY